MVKKEYVTDNGIIRYDVIIKNNNLDTVVLLHGWGMERSTFKSIVSKINNKFNIINIDFLGFGESDVPNKCIGVKEYTKYIKGIIDENNINSNKLILIGHSFGGRVCIRYGSLYKYKKIFLVSAPAFKNKSLQYYKKVIVYKLKKNILKVISRKKYYKFIKNKGSNDYKNASGIMKDIFKKVVRYDLTSDLKKLTNNVVILSSVNDDVVCYKDQIKMYKMIDNSIFYPFYKSNHFLYITEEDKFIDILYRELGYVYNI